MFGLRLTNVAEEDGQEDEAMGGSDQDDAEIHPGNLESVATLQ